MMDQLWKISFKTRISGLARIAYRDNEVFIVASSKAEAQRIFGKCLKQNKRNGTWCVLGSELKTYCKPVLAAFTELQAEPKSCVSTFERIAHSEFDIDALIAKRAAARAAQQAAWKARYGRDMFENGEDE